MRGADGFLKVPQKNCESVLAYLVVDLQWLGASTCRGFCGFTLIAQLAENKGDLQDGEFDFSWAVFDDEQQKTHRGSIYPISLTP